LFLCLSLLAYQGGFTETGVKVKSLRGEVRVRRGLEEAWHPAGVGMILEDIDTILTGEVSEVVLVLVEGNLFTLGSNSIIDIGDLRKITERELFLYLMSQKLKRIEKREEKSKLRIENISVVRAERKGHEIKDDQEKLRSDMWRREINGARALYAQRYYPNTVVKLYKVLEKYSSMDDCGEIHFYIGKSFEALSETGRAIDAYQQVLERTKESSCDSLMVKKYFEASAEAILRLKQ